MKKVDCEMCFEVDGVLVCAYDFTRDSDDDTILKECSDKCELKQAQHHNNNHQQNTNNKWRNRWNNK